jgi:hypothetical protein
MRQEILIPVASAARELERSERTIRYWLSTGRLAGERVGRDWVVYVKEEV